MKNDGQKDEITLMGACSIRTSSAFGWPAFMLITLLNLVFTLKLALFFCFAFGNSGKSLSGQDAGVVHFFESKK